MYSVRLHPTSGRENGGEAWGATWDGLTQQRVPAREARRWSVVTEGRCRLACDCTKALDMTTRCKTHGDADAQVEPRTPGAEPRYTSGARSGGDPKGEWNWKSSDAGKPMTAGARTAHSPAIATRSYVTGPQPSPLTWRATAVGVPWPVPVSATGVPQ
ncbi:hypothetical protein L1887_60177 [Cichorium endivia]|nr:hypothetical protein L1887_60177 [Cichorium endivia]